VATLKFDIDIPYLPLAHSQASLSLVVKSQQ